MLAVDAMSIVAFGAALWAFLRTRRLGRLARELHLELCKAAEDAALADWAKHTTLSVITVTGAEFTMTLADIRTSEHGALRTWNVPTYVALRPRGEAVPLTSVKESSG